MKDARDRAEEILAAHAEWLGPFDLESVLWTLNHDVLVVVHPLTSETTWMVHIAAAPGTHGRNVFRGMMEADRWFRGNMPGVMKLVAFVRSDNFRALRAAACAGFNQEGFIKDYYYKDGLFHDVVVMGRRQ